LLRPFHLDDVPAVTAACQDQEISRWTVSIPWPYEERHARSWIETHEWLREEGSAFPFAITDRRSGQLLGSIGIEHAGDPPGAGDVGYWVAASARNRGVATEALEMISAWAFQRLRLDRIHLVTKTGNVASERVAEKAGYRFVSEVTDYIHRSEPTRTLHVKQWVRSASAEGSRGIALDFNKS
jgi:RimJ/RimL family protein N-acetyltransferase